MAVRRRRQRIKNLRHIRPDIGAGLFLLPVTFYFCAKWGLQPNSNLQTYLLVGSGMVLLAAVPTVFLFAVGNTALRRWKRLRAAKFNVSALATNMLFLILMSWIYTHLKAGVLTGQETYDPLLQRIDMALCNGQNPVELASHWIPRWASLPLAIVYMTFFPVLISCIIWLSLEGDQENSDDMTCAIILAYYVGVLLYHLVPAFGPAYSIANSLVPGVNDSLAKVQNELLQSVADVRNRPAITQILPWRYIGAFPSLHVTGVLIAVWYLQPYRIAYWAMNCFAVLTAVSTVYFGWHYLADWVGGFAVAAVAIWITAMFRRMKNIHRRLDQVAKLQVIQPSPGVAMELHVTKGSQPILAKACEPPIS